MKRYLVIAYVLFFGIYLVGTDIMATLNVGRQYKITNLINPVNLSTIFNTVLYVLLSHRLVFNKLYDVKPRWKLFASLVLLLCVFIVHRYLVEEVLFRKLFGYGNYFDKASLRYYAVDNIYYGGILIFIGFVFFLVEQWIEGRQRQAALREENRLAELRFLQAQMDPHFLFNALNNIYSLAYQKHPQTANAVLKLSDMMRSISYLPGACIPLETELTYIRTMLDIHQLRCDYPLQFRIDIDDRALKTEVLAFLLLPLVENVFKHGDLSDPSNPLQITGTCDSNQLMLNISSKISGTLESATPGIGISNTRRRLQLYYPKQNFRFDNFTEGVNYKTIINLPV